MRFYVCWFLAAAEDAAAIRSIATSGERKLDEWPHLIVPGVDGPDMNKLEKVVRPKRTKGSPRVGGEILDRSKMSATPFTAVCRVTPEFVELLAALDEPTAGERARAWADAIEGVSAEAALQLVCQMAQFARQAAQAGKPVLQLDIM